MTTITKFDVSNEDETKKIAIDFSKSLKNKDIVLLSGELGAGKTLFVRALIQNLCGAETVVKSPSFPILQTYKNNENQEIFHYDIYRLSNEDELNELDFEYAVENAIVIIEWPEMAKGTFERLAQTHSLTEIKISYKDIENPDSRTIVIEKFEK